VLSFLHHPAFQSLLLPCLLALLAMAALRVGCGARWAPLGAALGLLGALAWLPGVEWPAASRVQKLPWTVLAGLVVAAVATARQPAGRSPRWAAWATLAVWVGAGAWLAGAQGSVPLVAAGAAAGGVVLGLLVWPASAAFAAPAAVAQTGAAASAAALAMAALGLAALAGSGGSLLLAQLALMLATCTAVLGVWLWLRPAPGPHGAAALLPLGLAWLALAASWALSASTEPATAVAGPDAARLALLVLALAVPPPLLRRRRAQARARWTPLLAALLAAGPVAAAVAWQLAAPAAPAPGTPDDDPYYTPA
jgi:hypothetical protein